MLELDELCKDSMNMIKENKPERQFLPIYSDRTKELVVFKDIYIFKKS